MGIAGRWNWRQASTKPHLHGAPRGHPAVLGINPAHALVARHGPVEGRGCSCVARGEAVLVLVQHGVARHAAPAFSLVVYAAQGVLVRGLGGELSAAGCQGLQGNATLALCLCLCLPGLALLLPLLLPLLLCIALPLLATALAVCFRGSSRGSSSGGDGSGSTPAPASAPSYLCFC